MGLHQIMCNVFNNIMKCLLKQDLKSTVEANQTLTCKKKSGEAYPKKRSQLQYLSKKLFQISEKCQGYKNDGTSKQCNLYYTSKFKLINGH